MSRTSLAIVNLRAFVILLVLSFHSSLAYLASQSPTQFAFDEPPYEWRSIPILDSARWFGFDLYGAWQYVFLMPFMFFLSGLFVWPSLSRKGASTFAVERSLRIGLPFVLAIGLWMPFAFYPVYRLSAVDPTWSAYWQHWLALPFWGDGPLWFLWHILLLDLIAAALYRFAPGIGEFLGRISAGAGEHPGRYFVGLTAVAVLAYLPLAAIYKPWDWSQWGPFSIQSSRWLNFAVYFFAGLGAGFYGIERGLLGPNGALCRRWALWLAIALASLFGWMGVTALTIPGPAPAYLERASDLLFAVAGAAWCLAFAAIFLRFAGRPIPAAADLSDKVYGIYLVHFPFIVWMQYLLLGAPLPAAIKGAIVFAVTLALSWASVALFRALKPVAISSGRGLPSRS
jgi:glucans biosynthesis protein C